MTKHTKIMNSGLATLILTIAGYMTHSTALIPVMTFKITVAAFAVSGVYVGAAYSLYLIAQSLIHVLFKDSMQSNPPPITQSKVPETISPTLDNNLTNRPEENPQAAPAPQEPRVVINSYTAEMREERVAERRRRLSESLANMTARAEPGSPTMPRVQNAPSISQEASQPDLEAGSDIGVSSGDDEDLSAPQTPPNTLEKNSKEQKSRANRSPLSETNNTPKIKKGKKSANRLATRRTPRKEKLPTVGGAVCNESHLSPIFQSPQSVSKQSVLVSTPSNSKAPPPLKLRERTLSPSPSPRGKQRRESLIWSPRPALNYSPFIGPAYMANVKGVDKREGSQVDLDTGNRVSSRPCTPTRRYNPS